jgi:hypothetical protein
MNDTSAPQSLRRTTARRRATRDGVADQGQTYAGFVATGQRLAILGHWSGVTIVDRLGAQIELIPRLFGATNRFPTRAARALVHLAIFVGCHQAKRTALDLLRICSLIISGYLLGTHQRHIGSY